MKKIIVGVAVYLLLTMGSVFMPASLVLARSHVPSNTCYQDGCDGVFPATISGTPTRIFDQPMIAHNGATVGHLYLYAFLSASIFAYWGTFVLSTGIQHGQVYSTRAITTDDPGGYTDYYASPSTGVYHDAPMVGCDDDYPNNYDTMNAAIDWQDAQGYQLHTQTQREQCY